MLNGHHPKLRRLRRQFGEATHTALHLGQSVGRATPMPSGIRRRLSDQWGREREPVRVALDHLLVGGQNRMNATAYADATGDLLWGSRTVADGPHGRLLALASGATLSDSEILASDYGLMASRCIALSGQYFDAVDVAEVPRVARRFLADAGLDGSGQGSGSAELRPPHASAPDAPVRVAPVRGTDYYQVVDGHHRIALASFRGQKDIEVVVDRVGVRTPLMAMLSRMTWIGGADERYQPLAAPELSAWPTVRACTDRFEAMRRLLADEGIGPGASYLDVASCYGWFVAEMAAHGYDAHGVERDPLAPRLGEAIYGLDPARISTGDAVELLGSATRTWDVVSCFSLLHHFALGRASVGAEELVRLLDGVTGRVLFLDTGQAHERWFAESLPEWDTAYVAKFLTTHGSFDRVVDLGPDIDDVEPYSGNYGRHLFACIRD